MVSTGQYLQSKLVGIVNSVLFRETSRGKGAAFRNSMAAAPTTRLSVKMPVFEFLFAGVFLARGANPAGQR